MIMVARIELNQSTGLRSNSNRTRAAASKHHFGVERTLHLAQQVDPEITRSEVEHVVKECAHCNHR